MLSADQPSQWNGVIPLATPYSDLDHHRSRSQRSLAAGLVWMPKEAHKRGKIQSCSYLLRKTLKKSTSYWSTVCAQHCISGWTCSPFHCWQVPTLCKRREEPLEKKKDEGLGKFSFWQKQAWNRVYLASLNWLFALLKWTSCANFRKHVGRVGVGRSEPIRLEWLMLSCPRTDTPVTSTQLTSKEPVWPHENELFRPFGRQKRVHEAVPDTSKVLSKMV